MTNGAISDAASRAAVAVTEEAEQRIQRITLTTGVVLRFKHVSPLAIRAASARIPMPQVPVVEIPDRGRSEPNPNAPEYLKALQQWNKDQVDAALAIGIIQGTEIESIPDGMYKPEDDGWLDELEEMFAIIPGGEQPIQLRREPRAARYFDWVRYYALRDETDIFKLTQILTTGLVLTEREVAEAANSFRSRVRRFADSDSTAAVAAINRNLDQAVSEGSGA